MTERPKLQSSCNACVGMREEGCQAILRETRFNLRSARALGRLMNIALPDEPEGGDEIASGIVEGVLETYNDDMRQIGCTLSDRALEIKLLDQLGR